jgi:L-alanine-DL-glutamate epimerase-like enolase superfamily enzyme
MKITALETILSTDYPNLMWLQVHTDEGLVGLGETFYWPQAVAAYLHEAVAPYLLGRDPLAIERHSRVLLQGFLASGNAGVETRGHSAIDIALWDIFGQAAGLPVCQMLGGRSRERVRIYNTCTGYEYLHEPVGFAATGWTRAKAGAPAPHEDLEAATKRPGELAQELLADGITAMKIWPFDSFGAAYQGMYLSAADIERGLEPFRRIREAVGNRMDVMLEFGGLWNLPTAMRIARAVEHFDPFWFEDPFRMDNLDALAEFAKATRVPVAASEMLGTRFAFRQLLERRAVGVVMLDLGWIGGLSEAKKVAAMAEAYKLPVAPHDCTGPVVWTASMHLSVSLPNAVIQEAVRAYYAGWYREVLTAVPAVEKGFAAPPDGAGLGTRLHPDFLRRPTTNVRRSQAET